jgi:Zinc carboxypeptidase
MASDLLTVSIHASTVTELKQLIHTHHYDYGCRPSMTPSEKGTHTLTAYLTQAQYETLLPKVTRIDIISQGIPCDRSGAETIGTGDRFNGGQLFPRGLGSRAEGEQFDLGGIMNVDEIGSAMKGLQQEYGLGTLDLLSTTAEGSASCIGTTSTSIDPNQYHVYFTAGVHARERGGPDQLIYFISDLLWAQKHGTGLKYGNHSYSNAMVLRALSTGIVFFPLVNPDGVRWDQQTDSCWRKNRNRRNQVPGTGDDHASIGVDINRNYDFLWDFRRHFDTATAANPLLASDDPSEGTFHGPGPTGAFSEVESSNVANVFDRYPRIRWYLDVHCTAASMYYSWGDDDDQTRNSDMNFRNQDWDHKRGTLGDSVYREWITEDDLRIVKAVASRVVADMNSVGNRTYADVQSASGYPTSGASDDYAFSRSQVDPTKNKVYGFTLEFGQGRSFYPTKQEFQQNVIDTGAGFMQFCLAAADIGLK